jgi:GntR family transcriptional regulator
MTTSSPTQLQAGPGQSRYGALAAALRERVMAGLWAPGSALPAETALAAEHRVALGTLRRALDLLAEQGLIERRHGRGTFVRGSLAGAPMLRFFRFGGADGDGVVPASRILSRHTAAASAALALRLGVARGSEVLRLQRLRSLAGLPRLLEDIWLPLPQFAALRDGSTATWGDLLYPMFARTCGVHVARAVDEISFGTLGGGQARALRMAAGEACALVTRQAYDLQGRCVELRHTRGDARAFHYTVTLT